VAGLASQPGSQENASVPQSPLRDAGVAEKMTERVNLPVFVVFFFLVVVIVVGPVELERIGPDDLEFGVAVWAYHFLPKTHGTL